MNKSVDERLVPNGEYIDALNIRMGSTEVADIGVVTNTKGNTALTELKYIDGTLLSTSARCIGALEDSRNETIYWFVHDPDFSVGATGKLDMIVSYNVLTNILSYHVISVDDGGGLNTTLNFNPTYLITGVDIVDGLLFFTDDYNQPRSINVTRYYPYPDPITNIDQFTEESILVIKRPPVESPAIQYLNTGNEENYMEDRFLCFAYRYRYDDNQYSAISQWSAPAFVPQNFNFSLSSYLNDGMVNEYNGVQVIYNTGGPLVKGIDILYKDADNTIIKVIEKLDKQVLGYPDNTNQAYTFSNKKIYTILPDYEILRLYDNVPRFAKAQTLMGNRLMYGNYVEGYNLITKYGFETQLDYIVNLVSESIGNVTLGSSTAPWTYYINGANGVADALVSFDFTGVQDKLVAGALVSFDVRITHAEFSGSTPPPTEQTSNVDLSFTFYLPRNYASVYDMATSVEFQEAIGVTSNIQSVANSCTGTTFTDQFNCLIPGTLDSYVKAYSGINGINQPILIAPSSPSSNVIQLVFPVMMYVDNISAPTKQIYEYYEVSSAQGLFQQIGNPPSLHSNRSYELGIVYMDDFNRSTTVLVSENNSFGVPCRLSSYKNSAQVTIPVTQVAPSWATRYKFFIKADKETYETIYSSIFFNDPTSNSTYFLLEGENARKVEAGARLIVKADSGGPTQSCVYSTVLEKEAKPADFIQVPSQQDPTINVPVPSGAYMKLNANNFSTVTQDNAIVAPGTVEVDDKTINTIPIPYPIIVGYPILNYPMNVKNANTGQWDDYTVPAGSRIRLYFKFSRPGSGDGNNQCEKRIYTYDKTFVSSATYSNMKDWWDGDNIDLTLDEGTSDVGSGGCPIGNSYDPTLASNPVDVNPDYCTNKFRFYRYPTIPGDENSNKLILIVSGTRACGITKNRKSYIEANIEVFRAETMMIFETEPVDALPDVFYENEYSYPIDTATGAHLGIAANGDQSQNLALAIPAIINTGFFNCFAFGNGAESYKIRDSIVGRSFGLGNRASMVSAQDYREVRRDTDITYSGIYNDVSNVNKFNEFNYGLDNYKHLEDSFGPIYILDGRETDVLVLQEDKISYVLTGKDLLSDAGGGAALTSVPEVLGKQIARTENYGVSFHPESYAQWGGYRYFTDVKRNAVLQLIGDSFSSDQLNVISENGMRTWFRDEFVNSFNTQKLGGYDPFLNEYVLSSNDIKVPSQEECLACGRGQVFTLPAGEEVSYCVDVGQLVGGVIVNYNVLQAPSGTFEITATYDGNDVTSGPTDESGSLAIDKDVLAEETVFINITTDSDVVLEVIVQCPSAELVRIVQVCVTNNSDAGKYIHNEYIYTSGVFTSPLQSTLVTFITGFQNPLVSQYSIISGFAGSSGFPPPGATMTMRSNKINFDDYVFDPSNDRFKYYRSNTLYGNNTADINTLLSLATTASPISGSAPLYSSSFLVPTSGDYLYLIWDYRDSHEVELCYSADDKYEVCCQCGECESGCATYQVVTTESSAILQYSKCEAGLDNVTLSPGTTFKFCAQIGTTPTIVDGTASITLLNECGCLTCPGCVTYQIVNGAESTVVGYYDCITEAYTTQIIDALDTVYICTTGNPPIVVSGGATIVYFECGCPT